MEELESMIIIIMRMNDRTSGNINKISLISTGAVTHAQASELKYLSLNFKKLSKNKISVSIPEDKNVIQNGTYLIFALNNKGVPSIGKIVMLN